MGKVVCLDLDEISENERLIWKMKPNPSGRSRDLAENKIYLLFFIQKKNVYENRLRGSVLWSMIFFCFFQRNEEEGVIEASRQNGRQQPSWISVKWQYLARCDTHRVGVFGGKSGWLCSALSSNFYFLKKILLKREFCEQEY